MDILPEIDFPINGTNGDVRTERRWKLQDRSRDGSVNPKRDARDRIVPVVNIFWIILACICRHSEPYLYFHSAVSRVSSFVSLSV
jgi:hypothetical protein